MEQNEFLAQVRAKATGWLAPGYDAETRAEVQRLLDNPDTTELVEAFYKDLEFGTGGLRGIMGVGSNRMNRYTVGAATQGLANYLKREFASLLRSQSLSDMTVAIIATSSLASRLRYSQPMASRSISSRAFVLPQRSPLLSVS